MSQRKNLPPKEGVAQARKPPHAPPVYRPQPLPKVLQTKVSQTKGAQAKSAGVPRPPRQAAAPAFRPPQPAKSVQPKFAQPRPVSAVVNKPKAIAAPRVVQRRAASPARAGVVQATKVYPNLHPGAVERVEPGSVFKLESFTDQYRLRKTDSHGVYVPNQQYNFVRTVEGQMLLHSRYRHPSIAEGRQVLYAGEAFFNNGRLEWWSNGSGHYQPDSEDAAQAALPLDQFFTYQQIIKGEHKKRHAAAR